MKQYFACLLAIIFLLLGSIACRSRSLGINAISPADRSTQEVQIPSPASEVHSQISPENPVSSYSVQGMVIFEGGVCCKMAIAGEKVELRVDFHSSSPFANISDMRLRSGNRSFSEAELSEEPWMAFELSKTFSGEFPVNWSGFFITVQYRDAQGNLSPVYYDDISIEGFPGPPPKPTPYSPKADGASNLQLLPINHPACEF